MTQNEYKKSMVLLFCPLKSAVFWLSVSYQIYFIAPCFLENKIYIGNFYKTFSALEKPTALDCQKACQEDATCEGITQNLGNGDCYFMSDVTGRKYQDKYLIAPKYCKGLGNFSDIFQHKIYFYKYIHLAPYNMERPLDHPPPPPPTLPLTSFFVVCSSFLVTL